MTSIETLRAAVALLLEFATERDAATAELLTDIADDAASNEEFDGLDPYQTIPGYAPAVRLAELIVGGA